MLGLRLLTSYAIVKNEEDKLAFVNVAGSSWDSLYKYGNYINLSLAFTEQISRVYIYIVQSPEIHIGSRVRKKVINHHACAQIIEGLATELNFSDEQRTVDSGQRYRKREDRKIEIYTAIA